MHKRLRRKHAWLSKILAVSMFISMLPYSLVQAAGNSSYPYDFISTIAGTGVDGYSGDGGAATSAKIKNPHGVAVDNSGNIYIADYQNYRVRKVDASTGNISTVAGKTVTGAVYSGYSGDEGPATSAAMKSPADVAVYSSVSSSVYYIYIADSDNYRVRKVDGSTGIITTVAGNGTSSGSLGDGGTAASATIKSANGIAVDSAGNLYIADTNDCRVRKVDVSTGIISTVAGTGDSGYSGENVAATSAQITPFDVAVDSEGNLYIADYQNYRIREVAATNHTQYGISMTAGNIYTIAGTGSNGYAVDGEAAKSAMIRQQTSLSLDSAGNLYFVDANRIRKIDTNGIITTVAGNATQAYSGDGVVATSTSVWPFGIATDSIGNVYIADSGNNRIRKVYLPLSTPALMTLTISNSPNLSYGGSPLTYDLSNLTIAGTDQSGAAFDISGYPLVWSVKAGPATISGSTLTITGSGAVIVAATVNGLASNTLLVTATQNPPALNADVTSNFNDKNITLTFTDDSYWRGAITGITVDGTALTTLQYTVSAGTITFPAGVLATTGSHNIAVKASGYADATVAQSIIGFITAGSFAGTNTITEWDVNADGLTITIGLDQGYSFADDVSAYKDAIIDGLSFYGVLLDKTGSVTGQPLTYYPVPYDKFITQGLNAYSGMGYFPYIDRVYNVVSNTYSSPNQITTYDRFVGLDPKGAQSTAIVTDELKAKYPGVKKGIINALKAGATVSVNSEGKLVIRATKDAANGYFSTFTNGVPVVNGGVQIANCDILLSADLPSGVVKNVNEVVRTRGYYTIQEMKIHPEVWEYVDESRKDEAGVFKFDTRIYGADRNTLTSYPYDKTYYVKKVEGNVLTEEDIRIGGTMGPNGTGKKLIKLVVDDRVGPTQWASSKNMSTFITNLFRTSKDAKGYLGGTPGTLGIPAGPPYTPEDDPIWLKVEDQITNGGTDTTRPYNVGTNKYVINYCGDKRGDVTDPAPMWMFYELPKTPDFDISSDMTIYLNMIAGFYGGSGQSTPVNGQPILGMDGRYSFTIQADGPKSTVTTIASSNYTVDTAAGTITNVPLNTSKATFLGNLTKGESDLSWDTTNVHDPVVTGDTLVVTAQDGTTKTTYTITVNPIVVPPIVVPPIEVKKNAPDFTADDTDNDVGKTMDLTFADDADYRAAITSISVNGTILTADRYTISEGKISLNGDLFTGTNDYTIVIKAQDYMDVTVVQSIKLATATASFSGTKTVTEWDINGNGLTITIALSSGFRFADNVSDYKDAIIDGLIFNGVKFDKSKNEYDAVSYDTFITSVLNAYSSAYFPYVDQTNNVTAYDRFVGLDPKGASSIASVTDDLKKRYPGVKKGIIDALKAGATVSVDKYGNLVIRCTNSAANGYFSNFTNSVPVVNGGIQIANCDILLSAELPAGVVQGVSDAVKVDGYFTIQEMKMHPEIWEYVDASRANEAGVFSFNSRINSDDKNTSSLYPYSSTYYVKKVEGNELTEEDIRNGGTMGPNGTGKKLIKIVVDTRTGPTQWASAKNMSTFFTNLFRTGKDATGYSGGSSATYTPADDPQWLEVENQIRDGGLDSANPYNVCTNKYVINYSGDNRMDQENPAKMWIYYELPKTPDFDIPSSMLVYVNVIAGLFGGSGQSTTTNGQPILGMDGRYFFTIQADSPKTTVTTIASSNYTVDTAAGTITNVPYNTSKETFLANLTKGDSRQTWDTTNVHDPVVTGDTLVVTALDGITKMTYTITVGPDLDQKIITAEIQNIDKDSGIVYAKVNLESITAAFSKAQSSLDGTKTVLVDVPKVEGMKTYLTTLPASVFTQNTSEKKLKLRTEFATVNLPGNMLDEAQGANAKDVALSVSKADVSTLTEEARTYIGDKPVIELDLKINGNAAAWSNNNAPVAIAVQYIPTAQEMNDPEHITVFYIDGSGGLIPVPSAKYDAATGMVVFSTTHFSKYAVASVYKTFSDIADYGWAKKEIEVLASKGIISGTGAEIYSPVANITRADFMLLLVKTLGLTADVNGNFGDVQEGDYYYHAVGIAKKLGIAAGSGNNLFNPNAAISRQDMMVLTERALRMVKKISATGSSSDLDKFSDKSEISGYAADSIAALVKEGLIVGSEGGINPEGNTTRAETAVFLYRIYNK